MPLKRKSTGQGEEAEDTKPAKRVKTSDSVAESDTSKPAAASSSSSSSLPPTVAASASGDMMACTRAASNGKTSAFKVVSWNINGIRAWLKKDPLPYLKKEAPDVLCFQEIKCAKSEIPDVGLAGYHAYWSSAEKKGYAGTGLLSKTKPVKVSYGLGEEKHDNEGRVITAEYDDFYVVTSYVPNSGRGLVRLNYRKDEWDPAFRAHLKDLHSKKPVILCGDLNVSHLDIDLANPKSNKKTAGFTPEERAGFSTLVSEDFFDSFRHLYPDKKDAYTFWSAMGNARAKNVGWRLDYFVLSESLKDRMCDSVIRSDVMGSDHCPITLFLADKS